MGAGGGEWAAVRAELRRPGLSGGGGGSRVCLGAGAGVAGTAVWVADFVTGSAFASLTDVAAGGVETGFADLTGAFGAGLATAGAAFAAGFAAALTGAFAPGLAGVWAGTGAFDVFTAGLTALAGTGLATAFLATGFGATLAFTADLAAGLAGDLAAGLGAVLVFTGDLAAGLAGVRDVFAVAFMLGLLRETAFGCTLGWILAFPFLFALVAGRLPLGCTRYHWRRNAFSEGAARRGRPGESGRRAIVAADRDTTGPRSETVGESRHP